ncbi:hypothetical protein JTE90_022539 [Oedothorax gibbosus]|uniref:Uncharacterized protein n=1 Tax=Oedothorax gibbosus TaxID=931172 RepID=A0AAV6TQD0_9ARAC|nr:hypothetical protein JTE90_022539 [Oedothorax gibbosus]
MIDVFTRKAPGKTPKRTYLQPRRQSVLNGGFQDLGSIPKTPQTRNSSKNRVPVSILPPGNAVFPTTPFPPLAPRV